MKKNSIDLGNWSLYENINDLLEKWAKLRGYETFYNKYFKKVVVINSKKYVIDKYEYINDVVNATLKMMEE